VNGFDQFDGNGLHTASNHMHHSVTTADVHPNPYSHQNQNHAHVGSSKTGFSYNQLQQNHSTPAPIQNSHYGGSDLGSPPVGESSLSSSRKGTLRTDFSTPLLIDEDDNKYRRRSPFESLQRWLK
jgi:hypothetical protein